MRHSKEDDGAGRIYILVTCQYLNQVTRLEHLPRFCIEVHSGQDASQPVISFAGNSKLTHHVPFLMLNRTCNHDLIVGDIPGC
jgi:hypothetical protein